MPQARLSPGICSGSGDRPELGPGTCCQALSGSAKAPGTLSPPPMHLVHYWPSNLTVADLITAKAQHKLTVTEGTVPQHVPVSPSLPCQPGLQLWSGWDHPWDDSLLPQKAHSAPALTLLPALGPGGLINASLLQGKNAVDNFHITGTFNFSFRVWVMYMRVVYFRLK